MVNEIRGGHSLFHWNQFAHVKNANSLVGQTQGFGAPVILLRGFTLGQTHAITPQNIREEDWDIQDSFTMSFNAKGRHDLKVGGEYMHDFTWETTCQTCMGQFTANNGTLSPDVIQNMIADVNDVSTWNLAPLSAVTTQYIRNVAMDELAVFTAVRQQWVHRVRPASCRRVVGAGRLGRDQAS